MYQVESPRLYFCPLEASDAPNLFALDSNPNVHKYLGTAPMQDISEAVELIKQIQIEYRKWGIGRYATFLKKDDSFIGWVGLILGNQAIYGDQIHYDLGYRLLEEYWGNGYATEAAQAWLDFGVKEFPQAPICAYFDAEHHASKRILEKIGMQKVGELIDAGDLCYIYEFPRK